jgi:hypothetical protein
MTHYRLDPKNLPQLTPEEERRLDEAPIDYSDIPPLGDEFFSRARRPMTGDILAKPELVTEIAIRAFARATKQAIEENDRLGIPSYGSKDGKIVVRYPPQAPDPWLERMADEPRMQKTPRRVYQSRGKAARQSPSDRRRITGRI